MTKAEIIAGYEAFAEMEAQHARDCRALLARLRAAEVEYTQIMEALVESHQQSRVCADESKRMLAVLRDLRDQIADDSDDADWWKGT